MHKPKPSRPRDTTAAARQRARYLHTGSKQWRAIRASQLSQFPLCEDCGQLATEVDHNTNDTSRNLIGVELSSLCKPCHSRRTMRRERGLSAIVGCDAQGWPLDPMHPWNVVRGTKNREQPSAAVPFAPLSFNAKDNDR